MQIRREEIDGSHLCRQVGGGSMTSIPWGNNFHY